MSYAKKGFYYHDNMMNNNLLDWLYQTIAKKLFAKKLFIISMIRDTVVGIVYHLGKFWDLLF